MNAASMRESSAEVEAPAAMRRRPAANRTRNHEQSSRGLLSMSMFSFESYVEQHNNEGEYEMPIFIVNDKRYDLTLTYSALDQYVKKIFQSSS